jgi:hypothetical protein
MSSNDAIVLKANFDDWKQTRSAGLQGIDPWLYYCVEQFVKPYMLDDDEVMSSITDGGNDGGIDAVFFIANQRKLVNEDTELDPKEITRIRLVFLQVKQSGGFKPTEIEKMIQTADDFFDLSKQSDSFGVRYNADVVRAMTTWKTKYIKLVSGGFPDLYIDYYYVTGDDVFADEYAIDASSRVKNKTLYHNAKAVCEYHFVGAPELWDQVQRRPPKTKVLNWSETPMGAPEGTVGLVKIKDYYDFLQDEQTILAERMFESNVRGYRPDLSVNEQIQLSLRSDPLDINFWLLNNGITIITPKTNPAGHLKLGIQDPQIVNGLQTSREIFNYFSSTPSQNDARSVLVRVIETSDVTVRDKIIRATNSQNRMTADQLWMTDQIHRDLEEVFKKAGFFYDRRKGFHKDQGKPIDRIISVTATAQAVISVLLQRPTDARGRPGSYFKADERYKSIFGEGVFPLEVYLTCVQLVHTVERFLEKEGVKRGDIKNIKFYIAALLGRRLTETIKVPAQRLLGVDVSKIDEQVMSITYMFVNHEYEKQTESADRDNVAKGSMLWTHLDLNSRKWFPRRKSNKNESE